MAVPWLRLIGLVLGATNFARSRPAPSSAPSGDEHLEAERQRAERALRLELVRQAGDREIGRLRFVAGAAIVGWLGTLFLASQVMRGPIGARIALGGGWALLLGAVAAAFVAQATLGDALGRIDETSFRREAPSSEVAGAIAPWLVVMGFALIGLAVLIA